MIAPTEFTAYLISGIWTDDSGKVSHYAVHQFLNPGVGGCRKMTVTIVHDLILMSGKPFYVMGWDYKVGKFKRGQKVILMNPLGKKYLWTEKQEPHTKNLKHLIKLDWFGSLLESEWGV